MAVEPSEAETNMSKSKVFPFSWSAAADKHCCVCSKVGSRFYEAAIDIESGIAAPTGCGHLVCASCIADALEKRAAGKGGVTYPFPCAHGAECSMSYGYATMLGLLQEVKQEDNDTSERLEKLFKNAFAGGESKNVYFKPPHDPSQVSVRDVVVDVPPMIICDALPTVRPNKFSWRNTREACGRFCRVAFILLIILGVCAGIGVAIWKSPDCRAENSCASSDDDGGGSMMMMAAMSMG